MKRVFAMLAVCAMLLCVVPMTAHATETSTSIRYFEDGSYLVTEIEVSATRMLTKVGSKTSTYYSADHEPQFKLSITGEFLYDGTTVTCTYASGTTTVYEPNSWRKISDWISYSGNAATYTTTFDSLFLGVVVDTFNSYVMISCDPDGNIS